MAEHIDLPVYGMDCSECAAHVRAALEAVPGVVHVEVFLGAERVRVETGGAPVDTGVLQHAVHSAGYRTEQHAAGARGISGSRATAAVILTVFGVVVAAVFLVVVLGEWLGLLDSISDDIPWWVALPAIVLGGFPVFAAVIAHALRGKVVSHTLMTVGVIAAVVVGEWVTAAIVVLFMRLGAFSEKFTMERSRMAVQGLHALIPDTAVRLPQEGNTVSPGEEVVPVDSLKAGDVVLVRPGERIPVDGTVLLGEASIDQATLTGESVPVDAAPGDPVWAATMVTTGSVQVKVRAVGAASTYGRVAALAAEAEANRGSVQLMADRFAGIYLPMVGGIAAVTYAVGGDPLATAAVLVVACSCSFALATPMAMMASVGSAARQGLLIKGGRHIEVLPRITTLLIDKTGTVTTGQMEVDAVFRAPGTSMTPDEVLGVAAAVERHSQHPIGRAILRAALDRGLPIEHAHHFRSRHGWGVSATVGGVPVSVSRAVSQEAAAPQEGSASGKTEVQVTIQGEVVGSITLHDAVRREVADALAAIRASGISTIELLTGDAQPVAERIAGELGIAFRAELLPQDKIAIVREYQQRGHRVMMVGDGVNDAPALVQADVGVAMGVIGSDIAIEAAHVCLLREDWTLIPQLLRISRRTMRVVRTNLMLTAAYNLAGLTLAALGILPPTLAAAAQSIPDIGILANSSRLLRGQ